LTVSDGTVDVSQVVTITEALPTRIQGPAGELSSGSGPLTSGHDAEISLALNTDFVTALANDPTSGHLIVSTNFQQWNLKGAIDSTGTYNTVNATDQNGDYLEQQINVYLFVDGIQFQAIVAGDANPDTWDFNPDNGLMTTDVNFADVHMVSDPSISLTDYLAIPGNEVHVGDTWTVQYDDTTGGNEQARYALFETASYDEGDPGITVLHGHDINPDLMYGTSGTDHLFGNGGDDILLGREGEDTLDGGHGNDTLHGGLGNDILIGGEGDDIMFGEGDANHFVFSANAGEGHDTINDFNPATDTLSFADLLDHGAVGLDDDLSAFAANIDVSIQGNDLVLTIHDQGSANGDTTVTLAGLGNDYADFNGMHLSDIISSVTPDPIHVDTYGS